MSIRFYLKKEDLTQMNEEIIFHIPQFELIITIFKRPLQILKLDNENSAKTNFPQSILIVSL